MLILLLLLQDKAEVSVSAVTELVQSRGGQLLSLRLVCMFTGRMEVTSFLLIPLLLQGDLVADDELIKLICAQCPNLAALR